MKIYQLRRCEEYWMQETHGLYKTIERAVQDIPGKHMLTLNEDDTAIVISVDKQHYSKPNTEQVIARSGKIVTLENLSDYLSSYEFYELEHAGYGVWGIFPEEVIE